MDGKGSRRPKIFNNLVQDFNNKLEFLDMSHLPLEILKKTAFYPCKFCKIVCNTCWKFKGQKPRPMEILHDVFCEPEHLGTSACSFFNIPENSMSSNPSSILIFSGIAQ